MHPALWEGFMYIHSSTANPEPPCGSSVMLQCRAPQWGPDDLPQTEATETQRADFNLKTHSRPNLLTGSPAVGGGLVALAMTVSHLRNLFSSLIHEQQETVKYIRQLLLSQQPQNCSNHLTTRRSPPRGVMLRFHTKASLPSKSSSPADQPHLQLPRIKGLSSDKRLTGEHQRKSF
uniref:Uncharacterized protein n=1 Tax=Molossus molossus TaxID=27622 RepID=A0A7J8GKV9_MOLMO|nr:hypothetical protein HJG59_011416 [Molossus molossus]